ncbi:PucR family transcriptional regulator [Haloechinothrix salitolerans]|uniref:PucR family transcriptional regulator n=1 Tax=Haloechinothrix salitolerans TaxID=926830 RepID=A0ABW2BZL5_9PSEU
MVATLGQLLMQLGDSMLELHVAPQGLDVEVREVVICDPDDATDVREHDLALVVGARGRQAAPAVLAAGQRGAAAVAVKASATGADEPLHAAARDAEVALLGVPSEVRWSQLDVLAKDVLADVGDDAGLDAGEARTDLFGLAQTIATVTGGHISIEDSANRVLAYSSTGDEVDELRRLSILGRQGPEQYLALLRKWGVYERVRTGERVVRVEARPELGIVERLVVGVHAGRRWLGTIWVARGDKPLANRAERALLGAARVVAAQLARRRPTPDVGVQFRDSLLAGLLSGRMDPASVAGQLGASGEAPAVVLGFSVAETQQVDRSQLELLRAELINLVSVHAAAFRRSALVTALEGRTYVLLPELTGRGGANAVLRFAKEVATAAGKDLRMPVQAGVGSIGPGIAAAPESRREADRVLDTIAADRATLAASLDEVRAEVLLAETAALLREQPSVRDPRVTALAEHDRRYGGQLVPTVLRYWDAFGDVRAAAESLGVHPNTVRYRVRRAAEVSGLDLADPKQRLFAELQLRLT